MKKFKWLSIFLIVSLLFCLTGCSEDPKVLEQQITELRAQINELEVEKDNLEASVSQIKVEKGVAKYIVVIEIKQEHHALDFKNNIKDEMNAITIDIPVDKEYYDKVSVGTVIDDSFRTGSMVVSGSFGRWKITIKDKKIQ